MIESMLYSILLILLVCVANLEGFAAALYLIFDNFTNFLSLNYLVLYMAISLIFPSISGITLVGTILLFMKDTNIVYLFILLVICSVVIFLYTYFILKKGQKILESRRFHKSIYGMKIVFSIIMIFAAVNLVNTLVLTNEIIAIAIFLIVFILMNRIKLPLFVYALASILIMLVLKV